MTKEWTGERMEPGVISEASYEHMHRYAFVKELCKGKKVLDIASGEGFGSYFLSGFSSSVVGVDIDTGVINNANKKYSRSNLQFKTGDVRSIPCDTHEFDVVISFETLEHITEHDKMISECKRVLKPGGILVISTPDKKFYSDVTGYKNPFHQHELYENEFKDIIFRNFNHANFFSQSFVNGSLIFPDPPSGVEFVTGDFNETKKIMPPSTYWIAIASDETLAPLSLASFFQNEEWQKKIVESEIGQVKKSWTYRIGNFLLSPFKFIRSVFQK